jgi:hypothetical protein
MNPSPCTPCGAKTRAGNPCKRLDTAHNGRCRLHGGKLTGPTTQAGKEQARINGRLGGRKPKGKVLTNSTPAQQAVTLPKTLPVATVEKPHLLAASVEIRTEMLSIRPSNGPEPLRAKKATTSASKSSICCGDCKHLSAGFTCLAQHTITNMNQLRSCAVARDW